MCLQCLESGISVTRYTLSVTKNEIVKVSLLGTINIVYSLNYFCLSENLPGEKRQSLTFSKKQAVRFWCIGMKTGRAAKTTIQARQTITKQRLYSLNTTFRRISCRENRRRGHCVYINHLALIPELFKQIFKIAYEENCRVSNANLTRQIKRKWYAEYRSMQELLIFVYIFFISASLRKRKIGSDLHDCFRPHHIGCTSHVQSRGRALVKSQVAGPIRTPTL